MAGVYLQFHEPKRTMAKIRSIDAAALAVSVTATLLVAIFEIAFYDALWYFLSSVLITFFAVFFASRYFIRKFVLFRLRPLYRIMVGKNISEKQMMKDLSPQSDIVGGIRDELTRWANKKSEEIVRLKENERYRKEFLGNVSHEIKTPVFTIQGYILTLLDGALEDPEINRTYLERTEKNIDRLINIVNDLDEISKLECGEIDLEMSAFDMRSLVREIFETLELDAGKRNVALSLKAGGTLPVMVHADRDRIGQVLVNLVSNSIKYGRTGGTTRVSFIDMFDKIMVEVEDDGIGISPEHHQRIFERFYRVDKSRSRDQGGTGLGLAIVKHIIEAHGEQISLRSEMNRGTTFSFTLSKKS